MKIETTRFGELEIDSEGVIEFPTGLAGFEEIKEYVLLTREAPFLWLQAANEPDLAFVVTNPWNFYSQYEFELKDKVQQELKINKSAEVLTLTLVVIPNQIKKMSINLKAPLIINQQQKLAKQIILEEEYPIKYYLLEGQGADYVSINA
ncbi:MAG: flagellar assembly protein FliW [Bacillota bacterium]